MDMYITKSDAPYGLPQSGALENSQLRKFLAPAQYYKLAHMPRLWLHVKRPIQFTLVTDDFGVKYVGQENSEHLINGIKNCEFLRQGLS